MLAQSRFITCHNRELHVRVWNPAASHTLMCWHGLARHGGDFEQVAEALGVRVIAPDTLGRGLSQWAIEPEREYLYRFYEQLAVGIVEHCGLQQFDWLGTSMGGILGMRLAAKQLQGRIRRLVINDVGPEIASEGSKRIAKYVSDTPAFDSFAAFEQHLQGLYAPFGLRPAELRIFAFNSCRRLPDGRWTFHYDPRIVQQFGNEPEDYDLWVDFKALQCPLMVIHGTQSDILTPPILDKMREAQPGMEVFEVAACGHAPALNTPEQWERVRTFLAG